MSNKTLVILSPGFPIDEADTTCLPSQQLFIKEINKNFPSLKIIVLAFQYPFSKSEYEWNKNKVIAFAGNGRSKFQRLLLWIRIWKKLKKLKTENNIIGLLSFWCGETAFIGTWFGRKNKIKHYCWISGQDAKMNNKYVRWIRPKSVELIAMSDFLADELYQNHAVGPAHIIPIGIAPEMYLNRKNQRDIDVLGVGSLIPLKQYDVFVRIIASLKNEMPSLKCVICGEGVEKNNLKYLIEKNNITDNVSLAGELPHQQVIDLMQRTKIFLHTSSYEGFGAVCIEALAAGAHVISFIQPMNDAIDHWHIVDNEIAMRGKLLVLLQNSGTTYEPVIPFLMSDAAKQIVGLFVEK